MSADASELRDNFNHFDKDANGRIDAGEFAKLMITIDPTMSTEDAYFGFEQIDSDHNNTIDFDEFLDWFQNR